MNKYETMVVANPDMLLPPVPQGLKGWVAYSFVLDTWFPCAEVYRYDSRWFAILEANDYAKQLKERDEDMYWDFLDKAYVGNYPELGSYGSDELWKFRRIKPVRMLYVRVNIAPQGHNLRYIP